MHEVLNWLWQGCAIALAAAVALRLLERARARARYALCWGALVVILGLPLLTWLPLAPAETRTAASGAAPPSPGAILSVPRAWVISDTALTALAVAWSCACTLRILLAMPGLRRARRECRAFPSEVESRLEHWNRVRARGRTARLVVCPHVHAAAVLGPRSPAIAVSPRLLADLTGPDLDRVIVHEWAHVQRRDDLINLVHLAVRAVAGWHPAVWWLERRLRLEREAACDEAAVAVTGSAKRYASCLAAVASAAGGPARPLTAVAALSPSGLRERVVRILGQPRLISAPRSSAAAAAAFLVVAAMSAVIVDLRLIAATDPGGVSSTAAPLVEPMGHIATPARTASAAPDQPRFASRGTRSADRAAMRGIPTAASNSDVAPRQESRPSIASDSHAGESAIPSTPTTDALQPLMRSQPPLPLPLAAPAVAPPVTRPEAGTSASTPWGAAADAGLVIGRGSERAAVAAAGFFTRFGKRVASSF